MKMLIRNRLLICVVHTSGMYDIPIIIGHVEEKYGKFAYSSKFGFSVRKGNDCLENMAPDNELVFEIDGLFFGKRKARNVSISGKKIISEWSPFPGIGVRTELTALSNGHLLKHKVTSSIACTAYSCGFALNRDFDYTADIYDNTVSIKTSEGTSIMDGGEGLVIRASPNTNLLFTCSVIPAVKHTISVGITDVSTMSTIVYTA